ncbi:uncharacterized protein LOC132708005 isoform X2 [Cylas formicarius]|nr:uncharacterized protein LOC132708005 isoform X2 [Cylas formicarius]
MAHNKNNSPKVVATLQAIAQRPQLVCVAASLMYEVWQIDRKYYHNLESLLAMKKPVLLNDLWQYNVTKANIFKKLCESCPELYGKDLVAQLSKLLNECNSKHDELPCALAIEGIAALCRSDVINVATTWTTLSKKFKEDDRRRVIKSLCLLISEVPQLQYSEDNEALNADVLSQLWHYASTNNDSEVVKSAFQVISLFSFENVCEHIPEMYLDENPELYVGGQRLVPGKTWLTFLLKCGHPTEASDFVTRLISKEVANYLKYVYQVKGHREPENYAALPSHSIVRALGEFLKRNFKNYKTWQTDNPDKARLYVECLKILSQKYPKPLPPLDWCFLQELVHEPDMRGHCLDLASHQVVLSGSARRLMENIIIAFAEKPQDAEITIVFRNLDCLANSIQPGTLKPFLQASFGYALSLYDEKPALFRSVLLDANDMLKNKNVQDINKNCLGEVLVGLISATDAKSEAFPHMLECLPHISSDTQQSIAKLTGGLFVHREFLKTVKIRCRLVSASVSSNPLNWLNDVIDAAAKNNVGDVIFADIVDAVKTQVHNPASPSWLPELLGQIQVKVTDGVPQREISYWCEVLILATVTFSGFYAFLNENYENAGELFPAALSVLMTETGWDALKTQVLEWLHHMHFESSVAKRYRLVLGRALCALRHEEEFSKNSRWMKYLDCKILASEIN